MQRDLDRSCAHNKRKSPESAILVLPENPTRKKRETQLIVAALPTNELTTVGRMPFVKPLNPSTRNDHFSARGSSTVAPPAPPCLRRAVKTHVERRWYTPVDGYRYRYCATPSAWIPRKTLATLGLVATAPVALVTFPGEGSTAGGVATLGRVWNGVAFDVKFVPSCGPDAAHATGLVRARVAKLAVCSRVLTMSNGYGTIADRAPARPPASMIRRTSTLPRLGLAGGGAGVSGEEGEGSAETSASSETGGGAA